MLPQPHEKTNMKNLLTAVALSAAVLLGFEYYMSAHAPEEVQPEAEITLEETMAAIAEPAVTEKAVTSAVAEVIEFENEKVKGSVNLRGGMVDALTLLEFVPHGGEESGEDADKMAASGLAVLGAGAFQETVQASYVAGGLDVPTAQTVWRLESKGAMTKEAPMVMSYKNATGQTFSRELYMDGYVIKVEDTVVNGASVPVSVQNVLVVTRSGEQKAGEMSSWYNFFGPQGLVNGEAANYSYSKVSKRDRIESGTGGYWGFTEQFFAILALVDGAAERTFSDKAGVFNAEVMRPVEFVAAGAGANFDSAFYVGPKKISALQEAGYNLEAVVDFGWFHFIAKPMFVVLQYLHGWLGNWGWSIVGLTVLLKLVTYPLAAKSYKSMGKMRAIQPEVTALKEKNADGDQAQMASEMMALYKKHGVNPMSGCWPMLVQIPIFFAMYKMVLLTFELRGADFVLWINDLSVADPWFVLPILMGISMWVQMRLSPQMGDPMQAKIMQFLPVIFTVLFLFFPSGLVLYWLTNNVISVAQQYYFMRKADH